MYNDADMGASFAARVLQALRAAGLKPAARDQYGRVLRGLDVNETSAGVSVYAAGAYNLKTGEGDGDRLRRAALAALTSAGLEVRLDGAVGLIAVRP